MTRTAIERAVRAWQRRLGLERFAIDVRFNADELEDRSGEPAATSFVPNHYDDGEIVFHPGRVAPLGVRATHVLVVHELLHFHVREIDVVVDRHLDGMLHRDVAAVIDSAMYHAREGVVDRLANRIVELAGITDDDPEALRGVLRPPPVPAAARTRRARRARQRPS